MVFKFDPNSTTNEGRWRLRNPADFVSGSYIRKNYDNGIGYVLGKLKSNNGCSPENRRDKYNDYYVQAIRFKKDKWSQMDAAKWWNKNSKKFQKYWKDEEWAREVLTKIDRKEALKIAREIAKKIGIEYLNPDKIKLDTPFIKNVIIPVGSVRRGKEKVGDLDLLITKKIHKDDLKDIKGIEILSGGEINTKFIYKGLKVDLFVSLNPKAWGASVLHYTGSFSYNILLRKKAIKMGYSLSQNGLKKNNRIFTTRTERELQIKLGVRERKPDERN